MKLFDDAGETNIEVTYKLAIGEEIKRYSFVHDRDSGRAVIISTDDFSLYLVMLHKMISNLLVTHDAYLKSEIEASTSNRETGQIRSNRALVMKIEFNGTLNGKEVKKSISNINSFYAYASQYNTTLDLASEVQEIIKKSVTDTERGVTKFYPDCTQRQVLRN